MNKFKLLTLSIVIAILGFQPTFAQEDVKKDDTEKKEQKVKPTVAFHGRIQYDFEFLKMKDGIAAGEDYNFKGQEFRRVYIEAGGAIYKNIKYKVQLELAGGEVAYRDMYIKFAKLPYIGGDLAFGSVGEATGMDMATSSKYITFIERSMMTNTQNFRWNSGIHYSNFDILDGKLGLQMSYAFNGEHSDGFKVKKLEDGAHFVARLTSPIFQNKDKNQVVHLGVNFENRKRTEDPTDYTLKFRPENHMGGKVSVGFDSLNVQNDIGFELAANFGPLSFQGEYEMGNYDRIGSSAGKVNGYYGALTYFVTGGHRGYKKGAGSRVKPYSNFCIKDGKFGALELVVRYSAMDYTNIVTTGNDDKVSNITAGFNWYLNSHARIMYNHVISDFNSAGDNNKLHADLLRLQIDF